MNLIALPQCEVSYGDLLCVWLQLMALLLLRHALAMAAAGANGGDTSTFFTVSVYFILNEVMSGVFSAVAIYCPYATFLTYSNCWMLLASNIVSLVGHLQLFLLRVAGFMLPCYIMARAMNILQRRRQRQVLN